ncbi:MAG: NAD(P)-dependent oxidoreductase, partial [Pseudorhodoplanes sp.]
MVKTDRLAEVIGRADYVFLCLPLIPATRNLFDAAMLARMKPGARLVNLARGGIVDEQALIAALESGHISGAVLDVFANEPLPADDPLWRARNLIITPHISGSTLDWKEQISAAFNDMVADLRAGKALRNVVDPVLRY